MVYTNDLIEKVRDNIQLDKEFCPTERTKFFVMLLASIAKDVPYNEDTISWRSTYRSSYEEASNYQWIDIFKFYNNDIYVYIKYIEEEWQNDERIIEDEKFCWRIDKDDIKTVIDTMRLLDYWKPYESYLRYKSECGLKDFYEYL